MNTLSSLADVDTTGVANGQVLTWDSANSGWKPSTAAGGTGDMSKSTYDTNSDGIVDHAALADAAPWAGITSKPSTFTPAVHVHAESDITGLATDLAALMPNSASGAANGVAPLGSDSKINVSYLPAAVLGALSYQGAWNASTNSPTIPAAAAGNKGWYYMVTVAGTTAITGITSTDWQVGDWIVSAGTAWEKIDNTDAIASWNGRTGIVVPASGDYTADQVTQTSTSSFVSAALKTALASSTGTGSYVLATSPTITTPTISGNVAGGLAIKGVAGSGATPSLQVVHPGNSNTMLDIIENAGAVIMRIRNSAAAAAIQLSTGVFSSIASRLAVGTTSDDGASALQVTGNTAFVPQNDGTYSPTASSPSSLSIVNLPATQVNGVTTVQLGSRGAGGAGSGSQVLLNCVRTTSGSPASTFTLQTRDSGAGFTEKLRVAESGALLVGTQTDNGVDKFQVNGSILNVPTDFTVGIVAITGAITLTSTAYGKAHTIAGTSADYTIILPAGVLGKTIKFHVLATATKVFTIDAGASSTIDGQRYRYLWAGESCSLTCSDGTNWIKSAGRAIPMMATLTADVNQAFTVNVEALINYTSVSLSVGPAAFTGTSNQVKILRPGNYMFQQVVQITSADTVAGNKYVRFYKNGASIFSCVDFSAASGGVSFAAGIPFTLVAGDYLQGAFLFNTGTFPTSPFNWGWTTMIVTEIPSW